MMSSSSSTVKFGSHKVMDRFLANLDVWQAIFEMLEVNDRIRVEMTNKRLRILMMECWKRVTSFPSKKYRTELSYNLSINTKRWNGIVSICVNRIGDGLRSLIIREKFSRIAYHSASLLSIGEGCPNVETINFIFDMFQDDYRSRSWGFDIHFDSFSHLKTLEVSTAGRPDLFTDASASVFLSIPTSIEVIRGLAGAAHERFENAAQIEGFFADRPSLREVDLADVSTGHGSKANIFRVIAERCPHLKSIKFLVDIFLDYSGVVALESVKELCIRDALLDEMEIVTICERSPLVEALSFKLCFSFNIDLQSAAWNALGSLTKLRELSLSIDNGHEEVHVPAPSLVTGFICELAQNSGASLRLLDLCEYMPLPTTAIEALANGCAKLRAVKFWVRVGEATPASIRFLIDCIVAHSSWISQTGERTLLIRISVTHGYGDEARADRAAFNALAGPAANLPTDVELRINQN